MRDGQNRAVGTVLAMNPWSVTVRTSTGHVADFRYDGAMNPGQIYYSGANCTGNALLNAGGPGGPPMLAKSLVFSRAFNSLMVPTNIAANGASPATTMAAATIDNPGCFASAGQSDGWRIVTITAANAGLPAYPLPTPFTFQ
jgi:hypothetical protein